MKTIKLLIAFIALGVPTYGQQSDTLKIGEYTVLNWSYRLDTLIEKKMAERGVKGVAFGLVIGDSTIVRGYGKADLAQGTPMEPFKHKHMFGSLSKLFTATLVMELVQEGLLDLHSDINQYLDRIQVKKGTTLHHLLTHTAGFEEQIIDRVKLDPEKFEFLNDYLTRRMPKQIFEPGTAAAYSNHGVALAGLIAEEVTGTPFETLIQQRVLEPLEMENSTFKVEKAMFENMATPYVNNAPANWELVQTIPASMLVGTVPDLLQFMKAQLNNGQLDSTHVLDANGVKAMQTTQYTPHPKMWGRGYGFFERYFRGIRGLEHGNTRNGFYSLLYLAPEYKLGLVVSFTGGSVGFRNDVIYGVLRMIFPKVENSHEVVPIDGQELMGLTGGYNSLRTNETTVEKIFHKLRPGTINVGLAGDNLKIFGDEYLHIGDGVFNSIDGNFPVAFKDVNGEEHLLLPGRSDTARKAYWWENAQIHLLPIIVNFILALIILIRMLIKRDFKDLRSKLIIGHELALLVFILGFGLISTIFGNDIQYSIPMSLFAVFIFPIVYLLLLPFRWFYQLKSFSENKVMMKIGLGLHMILCLIFVWQLFYWNWVGFGF
ncbi:MAG: serine hydrolase domain-containing protein [Cyclobacteriaceae bacterium]